MAVMEMTGSVLTTLKEAYEGYKTGLQDIEADLRDAKRQKETILGLMKEEGIADRKALDKAVKEAKKELDEALQKAKAHIATLTEVGILLPEN